MKILLIDGQGGKLGRLLAETIAERFPEEELIAVGTNALATSAMLKGGVRQAATGENPVVANCRTADVIIGPIGMVIADALLGEITPAMATAVGQSQALKILIPSTQCHNLVAGIGTLTVSELVSDAMDKLADYLQHACR